MTTSRILVYIAVMAGVTYLIRMLPMAVFRKKIESRFLKSFLFYVPYAVLAVMTVPAVFTSTGNLATALAGFLVAVLLAYRGAALLPVALAACGAALAGDFLLRVLF
ncbi:MAG: AzlD domain-containing protein [Ruthenibacterium sp.]